MPLLPLSSTKYAPIPETEDVTPVGRDLPSVYPDKSRKLFYFVIIFAILLIPFVMIYEELHQSMKGDVIMAFQTSKQTFETQTLFDQIMHPMKSADISRYWIEKGLPSFSFGNMREFTSEEINSAVVNSAGVTVTKSVVGQEVIGFGGAFTESAAVNFYKLPGDIREKVLSLYFEPLRKSHGIAINTASGIRSVDPSQSTHNLKKQRDIDSTYVQSTLYAHIYQIFALYIGELSHSLLSLSGYLDRTDHQESGLSMGRIHINSCDFSLESYNFDNVTNDYDLEFFDHDVTHDSLKIIPFISAAMRKSQAAIKLVASPWSPPAWMKVPSPDNKTSMSGSSLPNGLRNEPRVKLAWARYMSYFVSAYARKGIPIWGLTPQNEPEFPAPWEACSFTADFEADFIGEYLGPVIKEDHPDIKLLAFDHNKDHLRKWTEILFDAKREARRFIDGMAFHWYGGLDRLTDGTYGYNDVLDTHQLIPDKLLLATEGCSCPGIEIDGWLRAERLAHDIMFDLQNYANGWIDWNLLVDSKGGPNHLNNFCDASMFANDDFTDIHVQPKFFYFAHFFRFIVPGSKRIESKVVGNYHYEYMDANIQAGVEIAIFACEKSSRQMWTIDPETNALTLEATTREPFNSPLCIAKGDLNRNYLRLVVCGTAPVRDVLQVMQNANGQMIDTTTGLCITTVGSLIRGGTLLTLEDCESQNIPSSQTFKVNEHQELVSKGNNGNYCVTAGWPFLNGVAFVTPDNRTTVVIMNEASQATRIIFQDTSKKELMAMAIDAKAILTLIY